LRQVGFQDLPENAEDPMMKMGGRGRKRRGKRKGGEEKKRKI
jgi:hypothetical protein